LGSYNRVTLADARSKRNEARDLLIKGIDPGALKQQKKHSGKITDEAEKFTEFLKHQRWLIDQAESKKKDEEWKKSMGWANKD